MNIEEAIESIGFDCTGSCSTKGLQVREEVLALHKLLSDCAPEARVLSAGTCTLCKPCAYPNEPYRFPDRAMVSMEAAGLVVSDVCTQAGIPYNHGKQTIAYSSCVLA